MRLNRRGALALLGMGAATSAVAKGASSVSFNHGVASGDPGPDRVIIWTRLTPQAPGASISYRWKLTPTP
jgi:alkaline phosphatase D